MKHGPATDESRRQATEKLIASIHKDIEKWEAVLTRSDEQLAYWAKRREEAVRVLTHRRGELRRFDREPT